MLVGCFSATTHWISLQLKFSTHTDEWWIVAEVTIRTSFNLLTEISIHHYVIPVSLPLSLSPCSPWKQRKPQANHLIWISHGYSSIGSIHQQTHKYRSTPLADDHIPSIIHVPHKSWCVWRALKNLSNCIVSVEELCPSSISLLFWILEDVEDKNQLTVNWPVTSDLSAPLIVPAWAHRKDTFHIRSTNMVPA